ncbi:hypothetical protein [Chamaesiphon minutus]|nr:hypothetical protein [Chamaesiphon minutus]
MGKTKQPNRYEKNPRTYHAAAISSTAAQPPSTRDSGHPIVEKFPE